MDMSKMTMQSLEHLVQTHPSQVFQINNDHVRGIKPRESCTPSFRTNTGNRLTHENKNLDHHVQIET
jgi:hypothetical protein